MRSLRNFVRFLVAVQLLPALESGEETLVGGQAVLEGVMMRSPHAWAIACRKPSGEVVTMSEPLDRPSEKHKWMAWPIVRGVMTLGYAMSLGYRALRFSANVAIEEVMQEETTTESCRDGRLGCPAEAKRGGSCPNRRNLPPRSREKAATISGWLAAGNVIISLAFFIFMYKYLPLLAATELKKVDPALGGQHRVQPGRWRDPPDPVPAVHLGRFAVPRYSPRLPVSRRRAQNRIRLRRRQAAGDRRSAEIFHLPSPLRHQLSDDGDADLDRLLHADSVHHVLGALRLAHCAAAA